MSDAMDPHLLRFLLLLFVINLGFQLVRRFREGFSADLPYNVLLAADAGLCVYALSSPGRTASLWAWLAIGIFVGAVLIPAVLQLLAQVAMGRARWELAARLLAIAHVFAPSVEVRRRLEHVARLRKAHAGNVEEIERELLAEIARNSDPEGRRLLQETLLELLAFSGQWERCLALYDRMAQEGMTRVSRPTLAVAMIRASLESRDAARVWGFYAELRKFDASDPAVSSALLSAEIMLLAAYGYADELERALYPAHRPHPVFPVSSKRYWLGLAHLQEGGTARAEAHLSFEPALARENPILDRLARELVRRGTAPMEEPEARLREELDRMARQVPDRFRQVRGPRPPVATGLFLAGMLGVFFWQTWKGDAENLWTLYQLGANFRTLSLDGEPWRLVTSMFLHAGVLHLLLNGLMLYMFGRILEVHFGFLRTLAVFVFSGVCGAVASALVYRQGLSVGASGAVFGMVGAVLMMFVIAKDLWHPVWRKKQIHNLVFLLLLNLLLGFSMSMIDNAAHIGGFFGGAFLGWFFLVFGARSTWRRAVVRGIGFAAIVAVAWSWTLTVRHLGSARLQTASWRQGGHELSLRVPVFWHQTVESLQNPMCRLMPTFSVTHAELPADAGPPTAVVEEFLGQYQGQGKRDGLKLERREPAGPAGVEVEFSFTFQRTPGRELLFIRVEGGMLWALRFVWDPGCADSVRPFAGAVSRSFTARKSPR